MASALEAQARLYESGGDARKALTLSTEALAIRKAAFGLEHPQTATSHYTVGISLMKLGRNDEAIVELRRAVELQLRVSSEVTSTLLAYRSGLALALGNAGQSDEALEHLHAILEIRKKRLAPTHPTIGIVHSQIAFHYIESGQHEASIKHATQALRIHETAYGPDHPYVAFALESLSRANHTLERWDEAVKHAERAWRVRADATVSKGLHADSGFILAKIHATD